MEKERREGGREEGGKVVVKEHANTVTLSHY